MDNTWLVIANATKIFVYHLAKHDGELKNLPALFRDHPHPELVIELDHPEGRMKGIDLVTDGQGHFKSPGVSHGKFSEHHTPHQNEEIKFAEQLANFLNLERTQNKYQHLIICAPPHFYGTLKEHLSDQVLSLIKHHILKDYITLHGQGLIKVVEEIQKEARHDF